MSVIELKLAVMNIVEGARNFPIAYYCKKPGSKSQKPTKAYYYRFLAYF